MRTEGLVELEKVDVQILVLPIGRRVSRQKNQQPVYPALDEPVQHAGRELADPDQR